MCAQLLCRVPLKRLDPPADPVERSANCCSERLSSICYRVQGGHVSTNRSSSASHARSQTATGSASAYVDLNRRLSNVNASGATLITFLIIISIWGEWQRVAIITGIQACLIAFNVWVNLFYLPHHGEKAEVLRAVVNFGTGIVTNHLAQWPLPVWLWLPFVALAFDHLNRRVAVGGLVSVCVVQDTAALLSGVHWTYPLAATLFAVFCSEVSRLRFGFIRTMLIEASEQRSELEKANASLQSAHKDLMHEIQARELAQHELERSHKLEVVGRLAAGIAHEINTPIQFVGDSIHFLHEASSDLVEAVNKLEGIRRAVASGSPVQKAVEEASVIIEEADLPYLLENMPKAFERATEGLERVATIVRSMKDFSHPDTAEMGLGDLNQAIESAVIMARNEYKYVATLEMDFGYLPLVRCHVGELSQVVLNLLVNAAHAIADTVKDTGQKGFIYVKTRQESDHVVISIKDTGGGIPSEIAERIFDPFFTTKEVGKGTGQGLYMARAIVVDRHGGQITFETQMGTGTTFSVRLPILGTNSSRK